jgi:hypothetical protein
VEEIPTVDPIEVDLVEGETTAENEEEEPSPYTIASTIQLQPSDVLRSDWDPHTLEYYFGPQGKGDGALWERFALHVDPFAPPPPLEHHNTSKKSISLDDCLDEFTREELLGEDDLWYCPRCKKHQQATKQFHIWKVPDVLVVHLKRFSNSRLLRDKIDVMVDFPMDGLDLSSRVGEKLFGEEVRKELGTLEGTGLEAVAQEEAVYDLFAVDEHLGGLGGGHYRAHALNTDDNQWYYYDDSHVSKCKREEAIVRSIFFFSSFVSSHSSFPWISEFECVLAVLSTQDIEASGRTKSRESRTCQVHSHICRSHSSRHTGHDTGSFRNNKGAESRERRFTVHWSSPSFRSLRVWLRTA